MNTVKKKDSFFISPFMFPISAILKVFNRLEKIYESNRIYHAPDRRHHWNLNCLRNQFAKKIKSRYPLQMGKLPYQVRFDKEESLKEAWQTEKSFARGTVKSMT